MSSPAETLEHPLLRCAREIGLAVDEVASVDPLYMTTEAKAAALVELTRAADRVKALAQRVLANADDMALDVGARSAAAWVAHETRSSHEAARADLRLGEALDRRWHLVREAVLTGTVNLEQARVIVGALDDLDDDLEPEVRTKAEAHLVAEAGHFDPQHLRVLGRRVLEVVDPQRFDDIERRQLEDEERRARETTQLSLRRRGDGTTDIRGRVPDAIGARFKTYLEAYAAPRRGHLDPHAEHRDPETGKRLSYATRLGHAFCSLLEAVPAKRLPRHGGSATSLVVSIPYESLRDGVGAAELPGGDKLSASETLRLACTADIVPMVLGGEGDPLHLGRAKRLFESGMRTAMGVRDGGCRAVGCDVPARWCEAHHVGKPWSQGGKTDIEDGVLLCPWHHHRAHEPDYLVSRLPNGDVRFRRRT